MVLGRLGRPGQLGQPLQVGADDADLRRVGRLLLQALGLRQRLLLDLLGHAGRFDLLAQLGGDGRLGGRSRPVPAGWRATARAVSTRAAACPCPTAPRPGSGAGGQDVEPRLHHAADALRRATGAESPAISWRWSDVELGREGDQVGQPARLIDAAHHRQRLRRARSASCRHRSRPARRRRRHGARFERLVGASSWRVTRVMVYGARCSKPCTTTARHALQNDVRRSARPRDLVPDLGDHADAAQLLVLNQRGRNSTTPGADLSSRAAGRLDRPHRRRHRRTGRSWPARE